MLLLFYFILLRLIKTVTFTKHLSLLGAVLCSVGKAYTHVFENWCNKGRGMYYPVCEMVHLKDRRC